MTTPPPTETGHEAVFVKILFLSFQMCQAKYAPVTAVCFGPPARCGRHLPMELKDVMFTCWIAGFEAPSLNHISAVKGH